MKLEQPAERSRLLGPPLTWADHWVIYKQIFPLILLGSLVATESVLLKWFDGSVTENVPGRVALAALGIPLLFLFVIPVQSLLSARTRRSLEFHDKYLLFSPDRFGRAKWESILAFQLEPIPAHPDLVHVHLVRTVDKKKIVPRKWSIALDRATQLPKFLDELKLRQQQHPAIQLQEFDQPLPRPVPRRVRGLAAYFLGFMLLLHGGPLLWIGCKLSGKPHAPAKQWSPPETPLERTMDRYFTSREQVVRFFLVTGSLLTGAGATLFVWSCVVMHRSGKSIRAQVEQDFLADSARARRPA